MCAYRCCHLWLQNKPLCVLLNKCDHPAALDLTTLASIMHIQDLQRMYESVALVQVKGVAWFASEHNAGASLVNPLELPWYIIYQIIW